MEQMIITKGRAPEGLFETESGLQFNYQIHVCSQPNCDHENMKLCNQVKEGSGLLHAKKQSEDPKKQRFPSSQTFLQWCPLVWKVGIIYLAFQSLYYLAEVRLGSFDYNSNICLCLNCVYMIHISPFALITLSYFPNITNWQHCYFYHTLLQVNQAFWWIGWFYGMIPLTH